jgi:hypothetical protein
MAGKKNQMADISSCSFHIIDDAKFLTHFALSFPLPQQQSWTIVPLMQEQICNVMILTLGGKQLPLPWWTISYVQKPGKVGLSSAPTPAVIPTCSKPTRVSNKTYSSFSLCGSNVVTFVADLKVQAQTPETVLHHVAQTIMLAGYDNPRWNYRSKDLYLPFSHLMKTYKCDNPALQPQLVLPAGAPSSALSSITLARCGQQHLRILHQDLHGPILMPGRAVLQKRHHGPAQFASCHLPPGQLTRRMASKAAPCTTPQW